MTVSAATAIFEGPTDPEYAIAFTVNLSKLASVTKAVTLRVQANTAVAVPHVLMR